MIGLYYSAGRCRGWDLDTDARAGQVGMGTTWLQCVGVDPGTCKGHVQAAATLLHVACLHGKALQEFCFIGT